MSTPPPTTPPSTGAEEAAAAGPADNAMQALSRLVQGDFSEQNLIDTWLYVGMPLLQAIVLIIVVLIVAKWVSNITLRAATKAKLEQTLARFFANMVRWLVLLLGGLAVLKTFGVDTTSFAAVIAAMGFAIGMALSGTLGNFAAGVLLLVFRPFKVGDVASVAGITAKVTEVGMFTTSFDTPDNRRIIVPNGQIFGSTIENITFHPTRRVDVAVGTDYSADLDETREVLMSVAQAVEGRIDDPEPVIYLLELGGSSINWSVRVWSNTADYWAVRERLTRDVKVALDKAGIGIPFPQMDVHLDGAITQTDK